MSSTPTLLQQFLSGILLRLLLLLGGVLGGRIAFARARLAAMPADHGRRRAWERYLARLERLRDHLANPDYQDEPWFPGQVAELARVWNDAGRQSLARRTLYYFYGMWFALPAARPAPSAELEAPEQRCTTITAALPALA